MNNLLFSISVVLPIFIIILLGYIIKKLKLIDDHVVTTMNNLVFTLALPAMLFKDIATSNFHESFNLKLVLLSLSITLISFIVFWIFAKFFVKDHYSIGSFVQASFRGNFAIIGLPIIASITGNDNTATASLILTFVIPLYSILSVIVLTISTNHKDTSLIHNLKSSSWSIIKNPMIIGILLAIFFSLFKIPIPSVALSSIKTLANMTTPVALICIGASINFTQISKNFRIAITASILKTVVTPLVFLPIAIRFFNVTGSDLVCLFVMLAAPSAISSYVMAAKMKSNAQLASSIVIYSTVLSVFTFTAGVYILKSLSLI